MLRLRIAIVVTHVKRALVLVFASGLCGAVRPLWLSTEPTLGPSYCLRLLMVVVPLVTTLIQSECFPAHILLMTLAFSTLIFRLFFRTVRLALRLSSHASAVHASSLS